MNIKDILTSPYLWAALGGAASGSYAKVKRKEGWGKTAAWGTGGAAAGFAVAKLYQSWQQRQAKAALAQAQAAAQAQRRVAPPAQSGYAEYVDDDTVGFADDDAEALFNQGTPEVVSPSSGYMGMGRDEATAKAAAEAVEDDLGIGYGSLGGMGTESLDGMSDADILDSMGSVGGGGVIDGNAELDPFDQAVVAYAEARERRFN